MTPATSSTSTIAPATTSATRSTRRKLRDELGWRPTYQDFEQGLAATIAWYRDNADWWRPQKHETEAKYQVLGR